MMVCSCTKKEETEKVKYDDTCKQLLDEAQILVYLEKDITKDEIKAFEKEVNKKLQIETITFKSKEEQLELMQEYSENLEEMEENPLFDSYIITIKNKEGIMEAAKVIESLDNVSSVHYGEYFVKECLEKGSIE